MDRRGTVLPWLLVFHKLFGGMESNLAKAWATVQQNGGSLFTKMQVKTFVSEKTPKKEYTSRSHVCMHFENMICLDFS